MKHGPVKHGPVKRSLWLCCLLMAGATPLVWAENDTLKVVYGDFVTPPAIVRDTQQQVTAGYLLDIYQLLGAELKRPLELVSLPRPNLAAALLRQEADLYCRANPAWYPEPMLRWSPPLFSFADLLISRQQVPELPRLLQHKAKIGTVQGYRYPLLDRYFQHGDLSRVDAPSSAGLVTLLNSHAVDAIVMAEPDAEYYLPLAELHQTALSRHKVHCMYSPRLTPLQRHRLSDFIADQARQGTFRRLLARYRWSRSAEMLQAPHPAS